MAARLLFSPAWLRLISSKPGPSSCIFFSVLAARGVLLLVRHTQRPCPATPPCVVAASISTLSLTLYRPRAATVAAGFFFGECVPCSLPGPML